MVFGLLLVEIRSWWQCWND